MGNNLVRVNGRSFAERSSGLLVPPEYGERGEAGLRRILGNRVQTDELAYHIGVDGDRRVSNLSPKELAIITHSSPAILTGVWGLFEAMAESQSAREREPQRVLGEYVQRTVRTLFDQELETHDLEIVTHYLTKFGRNWEDFKIVDGLDYGPFHSSRVQQYVGLFFAYDLLAVPDTHKTLIRSGDYGREIKFVEPEAEAPSGWIRLRDCKRSIEYSIRAETAALLHDIGKIGVDPETLRKRGRLTAEERIEIQSHVIVGENMILNKMGETDVSRRLATVVACHHIWYDGRGYTSSLHTGMKGSDIPLVARLITLADAVDVMTVKRCYTSGVKTWEEVAQELQNKAGTQFDPEAVNAFVYLIKAHQNDLECIRNFMGPGNQSLMGEARGVIEDGVRVH